MALTKVSGDILDTGIVVAGVVTATSFDGPITGNVTGSATSISGTPDITVRNISGVGATFTGNVSIGGTLTYQDVTNVDSTGIATARVGLDILSGGLNIVGLTTGLHVSGVSTFIGAINGNVTGNVTGDVTGTASNASGATGDFSIADKIIHTGDTNTAIRFPSADTISFETAGTPRLNITSGGILEHYAEASFVKAGHNYIRIGSSNAGGATLTLDGDSNGDGTGADYCMIKHDTDGHLKIYGDNPANAANIEFYSNSSSETLRITSGGNLKLPDNAKIELGGVQTGAGDLQIYHSAGSDSVIHHTATSGSTLRLRSRGFTFKNQANSQTVATFNEGDACKLFFSGGEKIATTGSGISVTGKVVASGEIESAQDYPNFRPTLDFNFAAVKKLDPRITYSRTGPASYVDEFGIVKLVGDNEPRFDHDPVTRECKGLLIEESRTNMFAGTAEMGNSMGAWLTGGPRGAQGANVKAPDGKMTAYQNVYNGTNGDLNIYYAPRDGANELTTSNDTTYTMSVWAKLSAGASYITGCRLRTYNQNISVNYNLATGVVLGDGSNANNAYENQNSDFISSSIVAYPDNWYRCIMTFKSGTDGNQGFQIYMISGTNNHALNSSGANGESVSFWGAQLEAGSYATSYIPTASAKYAADPNSPYRAPEPRGSDDLVIDEGEFDDFINKSEGTILADYKVIGGDPEIMYLSNNNSNCRIGLYEAGSSQTRFLVNNSGTLADTTDSTGTTVGDNIKSAGAYKLNDVAASKNGVISSTDSSVTIPDGIDRAYIGGYYNGDVEGSLGLRRLVYYQQRLPNSQLVTLTA